MPNRQQRREMEWYDKHQSQIKKKQDQARFEFEAKLRRQDKLAKRISKVQARKVERLKDILTK